jgi:hypothetical protein
MEITIDPITTATDIADAIADWKETMPEEFAQILEATPGN